MFKPGDVVRHQAMAEWGLGKIVSLTGDGKVLVKFAGRPSDVMLTMAGADAHLTRDSSEWQDGPKPKRSRTKVLKKMPCITCTKDLQQSFAYGKAGWKACPECSAKNGRQHVLRPYPSAFEASGVEGEVAIKANAAHAGWCLSCASNGAIQLDEPKVCSDFTK